MGYFKSSSGKRLQAMRKAYRSLKGKKMRGRAAATRLQYRKGYLK